MEIASEILTGRTPTHVAALSPHEPLVNKAVIPALQSLQAAALSSGFELRVVSGFRDYPTQLKIWNEKCRGLRPVLDDGGKPLATSALSPEALLHAILRWSALPGASRHHWGTDIDVIDQKALPPGYRVQLIPGEVERGGMFAPLHDWLDDNLAAHGFFRPYATDRGGVSPERWHLSYAPLATPYLEAYTLAILEESIRNSELALKETALASARTIYQRYIRNINAPADEKL